MALYNEILAGRYNRFLQKLLQLKGQAPAPQLASEITPAFDVEDIPVELRVLIGTNLYLVFTNIPAVAAQTAGAQFQNPVNSNVVGTVEQIYISPAAASTVTVSTAFNAPAQLTNAFVGTRRDARTVGRPACQYSSANNIADLALAVMGFGTSTGVTALLTDRHQEWPVLPGQAIRVLNNTVNVNTFITFMWRERAMEESEQNA